MNTVASSVALIVPSENVIFAPGGTFTRKRIVPGEGETSASR